MERIAAKDLAGVKSLVDLESFINYFSASLILNNWDGYANNYFLYLNERQKFAFAPERSRKDLTTFCANGLAVPGVVQKNPLCSAPMLAKLKLAPPAVLPTSCVCGWYKRLLWLSFC